ncbi:amidohydrolase family protein [Gorillibacterium sp. sgz5001074]|uniref:amidohydrolase family protein n=1 Tax=Gorillibacterium sp. sgz5001074 TaxID=3446695 RepID=UPI003F66E53C
MASRWMWASQTIILLGAVFVLAGCEEQTNSAQETESAAVVSTPSVLASAGPVKTAEPQTPSMEQLVERYKGLELIDAHNHDASDSRYQSQLGLWKQTGLGRTVLFGDVSEPSAVGTDAVAWEAYLKYPDRVIPYFSGFDLHDPGCLQVIRGNLEKGYFGLGEIAVASTNSPVVSKVAWKANDPMDGYLPQIYDLIAEYNAPILIHLDPVGGEPLAKLEQALEEHPDTIFIFGHINAYNSPQETERLMAKHPNLYGDFFAGFTLYNPDGGGKAEPFLPVLKKYADRFMLSTDSGYGITEVRAIEAMYRVLDQLGDPVVQKNIAHDNLMKLLQAQPATQTQLKELRKQGAGGAGTEAAPQKLSKLEAGRLLAQAPKG